MGSFDDIERRLAEAEASMLNAEAMFQHKMANFEMERDCRSAAPIANPEQMAELETGQQAAVVGHVQPPDSLGPSSTAQWVDKISQEPFEITKPRTAYSDRVGKRGTITVYPTEARATQNKAASEPGSHQTPDDQVAAFDVEARCECNPTMYASTFPAHSSL